MSDKKSHLEIVREVLREAEVEFDEQVTESEEGPPAKTTLTFGEAHINVDAYTGFYSSLIFGPEGRLQSVRVGER